MTAQFLSHPLSKETPLYGGVDRVEITPCKSISVGDSCNTSWLKFPNHSSTHIDMPNHFLPDGKTLTDVPADFWVFRRPVLIDVPAFAGVLIEFDPTDLIAASLLAEADLLLMRTGFESRRGSSEYWSDGPGIAASMGERLRSSMPRLRALGVDLISITAPRHREAGRQAHRELLGREIALIEDMKLGAIRTQLTQVIVAPLLVEGLDGAPVTVIGT